MFCVRLGLFGMLAAVAVSSAAAQGVMQGAEFERPVTPLAGVPAGPGPGVQVEGAVMPPVSVGAALVDMGSRADVVFVGQVQKIERKGGVVEVVFVVEQPVAGIEGGSYTLREWAGLWTGGRTRYYVGQRAMMFLHAAGAVAGVGAGLSSPVDGMAGVVPVVVQGADAPPLVDVRRLAAGVERQMGARLGGTEIGAITLNAAMTAVHNGALVRNGKKVVLLDPVRLPLPIPLKPIVVGGGVGGEDSAGVRLERVQ